MNLYRNLAAAAAAGCSCAVASPVIAQDTTVTAIDVALEPDATMVDAAKAANARLREGYPDGFDLDDTHNPHVSLLQTYVKTADLDKVYAAVAPLVDEAKAASANLEAHKYYFIPWGEIGLGGIVVESTDPLLKLQADIIAAVAPYRVDSGTVDAFYSTEGGKDIVKPVIDYVAAYFPDASGSKFNGHVTTGLAQKATLEAIVAEPFDAFTFSNDGLSVYQLGAFGTARKELQAWDFKAE
jgi:hypothetical protein